MRQAVTAFMTLRLSESRALLEEMGVALSRDPGLPDQEKLLQGLRRVVADGRQGEFVALVDERLKAKADREAAAASAPGMRR